MSQSIVGPKLSRRQILNRTLVTTLRALARGVPAFAQQIQTLQAPGITLKPKGPLVFLDYNQEELHHAYSQELWVPNQAKLAKRNTQKRAQTIARLDPPRHLAYKPTNAEKLDLYQTRKPNT